MEVSGLLQRLAINYWVKSSGYGLNKLRGLQSPTLCSTEEALSLSGVVLQFSSHPAHSLVTTPTEQFWLQNEFSYIQT
jgi:hypothetical protein